MSLSVYTPLTICKARQTRITKAKITLIVEILNKKTLIHWFERVYNSAIYVVFLETSDDLVDTLLCMFQLVLSSHVDMFQKIHHLYIIYNYLLFKGISIIPLLPTVSIWQQWRMKWNSMKIMELMFIQFCRQICSANFSHTSLTTEGGQSTTSPWPKFVASTFYVHYLIYANNVWNMMNHTATTLACKSTTN